MFWLMTAITRLTKEGCETQSL